MDVIRAQTEIQKNLSGPIYRFEAFGTAGATRVSNSDFNVEDYEVETIFTLLIGKDDYFFANTRRGDGSDLNSGWFEIA